MGRLLVRTFAPKALFTRTGGRGTAADLAASGFIAVYPITGWWRERPNGKGYEKKSQILPHRVLGKRQQRRASL